MLDKTDQSADVSDNWNFVIFIVCDAIRRNANISSKFRFMFFLFILRYCCADFLKLNYLKKVSEWNYFSFVFLNLTSEEKKWKCFLF